MSVWPFGRAIINRLCKHHLTNYLTHRNVPTWGDSLCMIKMHFDVCHSIIAHVQPLTYPVPEASARVLKWCIVDHCFQCVVCLPGGGVLGLDFVGHYTCVVHDGVHVPETRVHVHLARRLQLEVHRAQTRKRKPGHEQLQEIKDLSLFQFWFDDRRYKSCNSEMSNIYFSLMI